jgi:hypothetical protein
VDVDAPQASDLLRAKREQGFQLLEINASYGARGLVWFGLVLFCFRLPRYDSQPMVNAVTFHVIYQKLGGSLITSEVLLQDNQCLGIGGKVTVERLNLPSHAPKRLYNHGIYIGCDATQEKR